MAPTPTIEYLRGNEQVIVQHHTFMVFSLVVLVIACSVVIKRWAQAEVRLKRWEGKLRELQQQTVS